MPRGVRKLTNYEAEIQEIDEKIRTYTSRLASLKDQRTALLAKKRQYELQELDSFLAEHNLSVRDVIDKIDSDARLSSAL